MKVLIRKISLLVIVAITSLSVHASLEISIALLGSKNVISNGGQFDASEYGDAIEGVFPINSHNSEYGYQHSNIKAGFR